MNDLTSLLEAYQAKVDQLKNELEIASKAAVMMHRRIRELEDIARDMNPPGKAPN